MTLNDVLQYVTVERIFTAILTVSTIAKAFCAATETPAANTTWGKIYNLIEILALTVGKSKQKGGMMEDPQPSVQALGPTNKI